MKCRQCKRTIEDNSLYCNWCGTKQIKDGNVSVPKPTRLASGEYVGRIMVNGKREKIRGTTEAEYYKKARAYKLEIVEQKNDPGKETLDDIINDYIEKNTPIFSPSTVRGYDINRKQIKKHYDGKVKDAQWQDIVNALSEEYAPKTVHNQWGVITAALKAKKIPLPEVKLPAAVKTERAFLESNEIVTFLNAIKGKRIELTALLALHSLRESEILALTKESVQDGIIHVRGAVVPNKEHKYVRKDTNKTASSTRDIPVFIPRLTELWDTENDPKFPHPSEIRRQLRRICGKNALPMISCHNLRHTFCSLAMGKMGWDIKTVQLVGGWSTPKVPQEIYTHLERERYDQDIKKMKQFYK